MRKTALYLAGGLFATVIILLVIKTKVVYAPAGSPVDNWIRAHPDSRDSYGNAKAPVLLKLISGNVQ